MQHDLTGPASDGGPMDDFAAREAPLEYWFFEVSSGDLALLVDWIVRKAAGEAGVIVSLWVRGQGRGVPDTALTVRARGSTMEIADATSKATLIDGCVDDVRWQLTAVPGSA